MNSSALGSRSLSRKGEGSMASNNCFSSPTWTSMTAHLGGIASPAKSLTSRLGVLVMACSMPNDSHCLTPLLVETSDLCVNYRPAIFRTCQLIALQLIDLSPALRYLQSA